MYNRKELKSGPHTGGKTNPNKDDVPVEFKKGGPFGGKQLRLDKRTKTSKNIQSSLNEILIRVGHAR